MNEKSRQKAVVKKEDDRAVLRKNEHKNKVIIGSCLNCRKFGDSSCAGANVTKASYDRPVYFCSAFSPKYRSKDFFDNYINNL